MMASASVPAVALRRSSRRAPKSGLVQKARQGVAIGQIAQNRMLVGFVHQTVAQSQAVAVAAQQRGDASGKVLELLQHVVTEAAWLGVYDAESADVNSRLGLKRCLRRPVWPGTPRPGDSGRTSHRRARRTPRTALDPEWHAHRKTHPVTFRSIPDRPVLAIKCCTSASTIDTSAMGVPAMREAISVSLWTSSKGAE